MTWESVVSRPGCFSLSYRRQTRTWLFVSDNQSCDNDDVDAYFAALEIIGERATQPYDIVYDFTEGVSQFMQYILTNAPRLQDVMKNIWPARSLVICPSSEGRMLVNMTMNAFLPERHFEFIDCLTECNDAQSFGS